jgi:hypothetical protein
MKDSTIYSHLAFYMIAELMMKTIRIKLERERATKKDRRVKLFA